MWPAPHRGSGPVVVVTDVLYVPYLSCNLFSALHLTQHKDFKIVVVRGRMQFIRKGQNIFTATVTDNNVATLDRYI